MFTYNTSNIGDFKGPGCGGFCLWLMSGPPRQLKRRSGAQNRIFGKLSFPAPELLLRRKNNLKKREIQDTPAVASAVADL